MAARPKPTTVSAFLNSIEPKQKRADAKKIAAMMKKQPENGRSCMEILLAMVVITTSTQAGAKVTVR